MLETAPAASSTRAGSMPSDLWTGARSNCHTGSDCHTASEETRIG